LVLRCYAMMTAGCSSGNPCQIGLKIAVLLLFCLTHSVCERTSKIILASVRISPAAGFKLATTANFPGLPRLGTSSILLGTGVGPRPCLQWTYFIPLVSYSVCILRLVKGEEKHKGGTIHRARRERTLFHYPVWWLVSQYSRLSASASQDASMMLVELPTVRQRSVPSVDSIKTRTWDSVPVLSSRILTL
jgi:hypothetical protein